MKRSACLSKFTGSKRGNYYY